MVSSVKNGSAIAWAAWVACLPMMMASGCKPGEEAPAARQSVMEFVCREIAVPAMPAGAGAAAARPAQLREVLRDPKVDPACLGTQLFRGPDSAAEQAAVIGLMQADPQASIRARAAAALGGVKGDPRPAFKALYDARSTEKDHAVAAAQLAGIADLLPSRAALLWDDGPAIDGIIALVRTDVAPATRDENGLAAARGVMAQRARIAVVLGDILDQAVVANKAHRADAAVMAQVRSATTGDAAGSPATWDAYELSLTALLADTVHTGVDDADWRAQVLTQLAQMLGNGRLNPRPRPQLAEALVRAVSYPASQVRVAALQAMGALAQASAQARTVVPDAAAMVEPAAIAAMHAAAVKAVRDSSPQVRAAAAAALGDLAEHGGTSVAALRPLLKDIDTEVRTVAEEVLARRPAAAPPSPGGVQ